MGMHSGARQIVWRDHVFFLFILCLILFIFIFPVLVENRTLIDSATITDHRGWDSQRPAGVSLLGLDPSPSLLFHPSDLLARKLFRTGRSFAWNPYVGFGAPWIGSMQPSQYYPPKLLEWILPFWTGVDMVRIMLLFIAGLGCYLLVVSFGLDPEAGLISAVSYMFCERSLIFINMPSFHVESLLPIMLFAIHQMVTFRSRRFAIMAGWIGACQFLGGFPEGSFIFGLVSAAFFLYCLGINQVKTYWKQHLLLGSGAVLTVFLLSGFQVAEFLRYMKLSNSIHNGRYGLALHNPRALIHFFLPYYFGFPLQEPHHSWSAIPAMDHMRMTLYCGVTAVLLALVGITGRHAYRGRGFFLSSLVFFAGYDYGFPILRLAGHLPLFDVSSVVWNAWIIPLSVAILAGYGMHTILNGPGRWYKAYLAAFGCVAAPFVCMLYLPRPTPEAYRDLINPGWKVIGFCICGSLIATGWSRYVQYRKVTSWLILAVLSVELHFVATKANVLRTDFNVSSPPAIEWFLKNTAKERIMGLQGIYPAETLMPNQIRDIRHADALYPKLYVDYAAAVWPDAARSVFGGGGTWTTFNNKLLDIAGVRYVFSPAALHEDLTTSIMESSKIITFDRRLVNDTGSFDIQGSRRKVLFEHPPSTIEYQVTVPPGGELKFSLGEEPLAWGLAGSGTTFEIGAGETAAQATTVFRRFYDPKHNREDQRWVDGKVDLSRYAGKTITLVFITKAGIDGNASNSSAWDGWAGLRWGQEKFTNVYGDANAQIYKNNEAVDRARFVPFHRDASPTFAPADMLKGDFDYRQEVYLCDYKERTKQPCAAGKPVIAPISTLQDDPDFTRFKASAPCDGFFVLADLYYPGWKATVDGKSTRIYDANYAFRAIALPAGKHDIVFKYAPWTISVGMPAAVVALAFSVIVMIIGKRTESPAEA